MSPLSLQIPRSTPGGLLHPLPALGAALVLFSCCSEPHLESSTQELAAETQEAATTANSHGNLFYRPRGDSLVLSLQASKETFQIGDSIDLKVSVTNNDKGYWALRPRFYPERALPAWYPPSELKFEIWNEYGVVMEQVGIEQPQTLIARPSICQFMLLLPDYALSRIVSVNEGLFAYRIPPERRKYSARAIFTVIAHQFAREELESDETPLWCKPMPLDRVFSGTVVSNTISFEYGVPKAPRPHGAREPAGK